MVELVLRWVKIVVVVALLGAGTFVASAYGCRKIEGSEMDPAFKEGSMAFTELTVTAPPELKRGDIILYEYQQPGLPQAKLAARIIGLPGDRVRLAEGEVFLNDTRLPESYLTGRSTETQSEIVVPRDCLYVLCDNRLGYAAYDSRGIGPIGAWAVDGRIKP